jgi:hypothetical protein
VQAAHGERVGTNPQVFHGTLKKATHTKKKLTAEGKVESEQRTLTVDVKAGTLDGTEFVFDSEGHEAPGVQAGPVVFQLVTAPHPHFTRRCAAGPIVPRLSDPYPPCESF